MGRLLIVDDEPSIRDVLAQVLGYAGYRVGTAASGGEAIAVYRAERFDLVLLDVKMQGIDGIDTLAQLRQLDPDARVIMISGHGTVSTAMQAVKQGAFDFLEKPLDSDRLLVTVQRALEHRWLVDENARLRQDLARATDVGYAMVGTSEAMRDIRAMIARVGPTSARVLITGENGSGKELVARAIHEASRRARHPFVEVNSAAIPSELVESELFGHVKGAFTGAIADRTGKFELANGGTLFLDEIGDLAIEAQAKILRVLEDGVVTRVGDSRPRSIDVRVIAATNRDLTADVSTGRFREDLYFRLNVMPIEVPPLRARASDIPALVAHFANVLATGPGVRPKAFTSEALHILRQRAWPGNVRELRNVVERLLILSPGTDVTAEDVELVMAAHARGSVVDPAQLVAETAGYTLAQFRDHAEEVYLRTRIAEHKGKIAESARALGIARTNLYQKMEKYGIEREES